MENKKVEPDALQKAISFVEENLYDLRVGKKAASVAKWRFDDIITEMEKVHEYLLSLQSQQPQSKRKVVCHWKDEKVIFYNPTDEQAAYLLLAGNQSQQTVKEDSIFNKNLQSAVDAHNEFYNSGQSVEPIDNVEGETDLQDQVREHIKQHDLFDWDEALTGEEMIYLENLLLTFMPIVPPGSIGYEKLMKAFPQSNQKVNNVAAEIYAGEKYLPETEMFLKAKEDFLNKLSSPK